LTPILTPQKVKAMSTINFYLKAADKKGECPIYLTYQKKGEKFRYFTKLKTPEKSWSNQRVKPNYIGYSETNSILDDINNILKEIERESIFNKKDYGIEIIKKKFQLKFSGLTVANDFFKTYDKFIEDNKATKATWTIKGYKGLKTKLLKFSVAKNYTITFEIIDFNFYEAFVSYMLKDLGNLNNTVGSYIKNLKVFLQWAIDREHTSQNYNFRKFKVFSDEADTIYLTENELMTLYRKRFSKRLTPVKDTFCFACFTGLRFSDLEKLSNAHIKDNYIEIKAEKTRDNVRVPLNHFAKDLLSKYKDQNKDRALPTGITNQKTNAFLKEIGELAKIDSSVRLEQFSGSNRKVTMKPKYELITTHTARRTFVTLALEKGIRAEVVMAMTGHKSYKNFMKYVKITDKVMEQEMNRVWSKPLLRAV
jgi:integrase